MRKLLAPDGGTPALITTDIDFKSAIKVLSEGSGPIAIDAERASGFRYSPRAYLIQLNRRGGGLHLLDPIALAGSSLLPTLADLISAQECIIHASSQDLPCLRDFGIHPTKLFDTELGARIAGFPRVGLAPLCETLLGIELAKEHSAVDWSIRPLRSEWLDYAALDVAVLIELRDQIEIALTESKKLNWAKAEFEASLKVELLKPRPDPWRRTSGMHQIKYRFELAIIREIWNARDEIAKRIDLAPGRLLNDSVIVEIAKRKPQNREELLLLPLVKQRIKHEVQIAHISDWLRALERVYKMPESNWPEMRARGDALPAPRIWREKFPIANAQLMHARINLAEISAEYSIPVENLITPEIFKRLLFNEGREEVFADTPKSKIDIERALTELGARKWQIELVTPALARARSEKTPPPAPSPNSESSELELPE
jgi:ribonuclease D